MGATEARVRKVLIVGSKGQLGSKLLALLEGRGDLEVRGADLPDFDITRERSVHDAVESFRPTWIINCAAFTDVEGAEAQRDAAFLVNETGVRHLADAALRTSARLIHLSTDYVFSGIFPGGVPRPYEEGDEPAPLNVYGESKLAGELCLARHEAQSLVVRTSWLYGGPGRNFLGTMLARARESGGAPLRVVDDQVGTPTDAWSLARQIARLLQEDLRGIVHASSRGETTWYLFAREIFRNAGLTVAMEPVKTEDFPSRARRPKYSVLAKTRLDSLGLLVLPTWESGLREALAQVGIHS